MKPTNIQPLRNSFAGLFFTFVFSVALNAMTSVTYAAYSLPSDRVIAWQGNVGVKGDIPHRTTIYTTLSPSGGNDSAAINAAITSCPAGQVVKLGPGTFNINDQIKIKSDITLRGSGMGITTLKGNAGMTGYYLIGIDGGPAYGTSFNITAGLTKGSTVITTALATGLSVGHIVLIDQLNDPNGTYGPIASSIGTKGSAETWASRGSGSRVAGQVNKITSISGTNITLETPLYWDYHSALTPQVTRFTGVKTLAGIEDLTIDNQTSQIDPAIQIYGTSNCWMKGVELNGSWQNGVLFGRSYRGTIRSCKFHEGVPALPETGTQYATSRAYGIYANVASASLFENNQFYHLCMSVAMNGPTSGNVVSYNYVTAMYYSPLMTWQSDMASLHGGHTRANLFEGNWGVGSFIADNIWGSSSHNVLFRNRIILDPKRPNRAFDVGLYSMSSYFSIIGNVLGTTGFETLYTTSTSGTKSIYGIDPSVAASTLIHANWDSVSNGVVWNGSDDRVLPPSLYLSSKPNWWGTLQWPAIGPDVSPMYPPAPAVATTMPWNTSKSALLPPTLLKIQ